MGHYLNAFGISIAFTTLAVIMAQVFVSSPFYIRQARTSFEDVDLAFENAARTLGASGLYTFFHVILPIAMNGLISGAIMAFARSLGEFGATIMFAGNFQGRTQTMPLAIYTAMQGDLDVSLCLSIILVAISFVVIVLVKTLTGGCIKMLEINVKKRLRDFDLQVKLDVARGKTLMLVGDNGCGKTTLLNLVAGLDNPDKGRIALDGRALYDSDTGQCPPGGQRHRICLSELRSLSPHERLRQCGLWTAHPQDVAQARSKSW